MKFGTLIEQKMLYQMTPRLFQSDVAFKVKLKEKLTLSEKKGNSLATGRKDMFYIYELLSPIV